MPKDSIDILRKYAKNAQDELKADAEDSRIRVEALDELLSKENPSREDIDEAMKGLLCYGSIAYCCGSPEANGGDNGKECPFRDSLLSALGVTYKEFEGVKTEMDAVFDVFMAKKNLKEASSRKIGTKA